MIDVKETKIQFLSQEDLKKAEDLLMQEIENKKKSLLEDMENLKNVIRATVKGINL